LGSWNAENRVIIKCVIFEGTVIGNVMTLRPQMFDDFGFELESCMVTSDMDSHEAILSKKLTKEREGHRSLDGPPVHPVWRRKN
jgi:hypothetical protein